MFSTLRNAWKVTELWSKLLFTLGVLVLYRLCCLVPVPFVNGAALKSYFEYAQLNNTILGLYNVMSGSAFSTATVLALSIQPYINASIIIQLLTIALPPLERLAKEGGEEGKKKLNKITRLTTVGLGLLMGWAYYVMLANSGYGILNHTEWWAGAVIILSFTAGAAFVMWLGERITEMGIGNGISMILFAGIISRLPDGIVTLLSFIPGVKSSVRLDWYVALIVTVVMIALVLLIVFINDSERRIPIQYAKRVVGRKVYGGQNTNLPIKVNMSGVMPIIFAQSIASLPATIMAFTGTNSGLFHDMFQTTHWFYIVFYFVLIIGFSYFYSAIQYDPTEIANNLMKNGGFIPGFRPGKPTAQFISKVIHKVVLFGAIYLAIVALLPLIGGAIFPAVGNLGIGGTSVIIVVGVALETVQALEAQLMMRHYKGFLE